MLKKKLLKAQETMKAYADLRRQQHKFQPGDLVFVKLRPYRQTSVAGQRLQKLSKKFDGPYKLLKQIGEVAFELDLPTGSKIHSVFHVSQLKSCLNPTAEVLQVPPVAKFNKPLVRPLVVFDWEGDTKSPNSRVLIQWEGLFPEDATWEGLQDVLKDCPNLHLFFFFLVMPQLAP